MGTSQVLTLLSHNGNSSDQLLKRGSRFSLAAVREIHAYYRHLSHYQKMGPPQNEGPFIFSSSEGFIIF